MGGEKWKKVNFEATPVLSAWSILHKLYANRNIFFRAFEWWYFYPIWIAHIKAGIINFRIFTVYPLGLSAYDVTLTWKYHQKIALEKRGAVFSHTMGLSSFAAELCAFLWTALDFADFPKILGLPALSDPRRGLCRCAERVHCTPTAPLQPCTAYTTYIWLERSCCEALSAVVTGAWCAIGYELINE